VGIRIHVGSTFVYETQDPFTATAAPDLLQQLANYRRTTIASRRLGLTHLMTGRELDDTTVGIAYLDTVCSLQSASLTEARSGKLSAALISLVAAHEIGHNFGAPHDGEAGKACAATNPNAYLMAPTLSTANSQFSPCSLDVIAQRPRSALPPSIRSMSRSSRPSPARGMASVSTIPSLSMCARSAHATRWRRLRGLSFQRGPLSRQ
jgi:hypothetical protein